MKVANGQGLSITKEKNKLNSFLQLMNFIMEIYSIFLSAQIQSPYCLYVTLFINFLCLIFTFFNLAFLYF